MTPGGSRVFRHEGQDRELELADGDVALIDAVSGHLVAAFGDDRGFVFHEIVSELVHVDVHVLPPSDDRPWTMLVTSGMAQRGMNVPEGLEDDRYAELLLTVPPEWPLDEEALSDEVNYWPLRLLKLLARLPHEYDTFLYHGHTVPNGDPPEPYAPSTDMCCALVGPPLLLPDGFDEIAVPDGRVVHLYGVFPLHRNEMEFKLQKGADALWLRMAEANVTELVDPQRPSVIGRSRRLFGRG
jgi:hypothetical protein